MQTILIVGDSYTYGQGCNDRIYYYDKNADKHIGEYFEYPRDPASKYCWASLLQQQLPEYNVVNLASPGNSQFGIFKDTVDYITKNSNVCLVLYNTTFFDRVSVASFGDPNVINPWCPTWYVDADKKEPEAYLNAKVGYVKYLMNDDLLRYQSVMSTLAANSIAINKDIKFLWSTPESDELNIKPVYKILRTIESTRFTHIARYDFSGKHNHKYNNTYLFLDNHTNAPGHQIYFEKELFPLVKRTLNIT
jgi:hypothetical protein